jgi:hypothetical protein
MPALLVMGQNSQSLLSPLMIVQYGEPPLNKLALLELVNNFAVEASGANRSVHFR